VTPADLEGIRGVLSRATGNGWEAAYRQDVGALLAEVERLRAVPADRSGPVEVCTDSGWFRATLLDEPSVNGKRRAVLYRGDPLYVLPCNIRPVTPG
jgi:hypothetical protein